MIVSWLSLLCCVGGVWGNPVSFPGDFTLSKSLTSATFNLPEESLLSCESVHSPTLQTESMTVGSRIKAQDLNVDLLIASGGQLEFSGLVQVAGGVSEETATAPAAAPASSPAPTFLQTKAPDDQQLHFSSFLSPQGGHYLADLEAQLNKVGHSVYQSFVATPSWTLFGLFTEESFRVAQLPPHRKLMVKSAVRFESPEWSGQAVTLMVDGVPVWQETHRWAGPGCEGDVLPHHADVSISTPHTSKSVSFEFRASLTPRCSLSPPFSLSPVLVYYR